MFYFAYGHRSNSIPIASVMVKPNERRDDRYLKAAGLSLAIINGWVPVDGDTNFSMHIRERKITSGNAKS
jgi:hypothetical protein